MRMNEIDNDRELREFMTSPTSEMVECARNLDGDVAVLGAAGKMGPDLIETLLRADQQSGTERDVYAVSRFSDPEGRALNRLRELDVHIRRGDLTDEGFLGSLPKVENVIYMVGFKFGSSSDYRRAWHINAILPYLVGRHFDSSRIVAFSSTNPYPHLPLDSAGATEEIELRPKGVYGWSVVARESAYRTTQLYAEGAQPVLIYRLAYAQHLTYGVLVDLARMIQDGEPISLRMPAVNLVSQRDAVDVALRGLGLCEDPARILNCSGPVMKVADILDRMGDIMDQEPVIADEPGSKALISDDSRARYLLGDYRDTPLEMIEAAAKWVGRGGTSWGKPTKFGKVNHSY